MALVTFENYHGEGKFISVDTDAVKVVIEDQDATNIYVSRDLWFSVKESFATVHNTIERYRS